MTETTLLTRCPHCETRFRVTDQQLGIAKGKVRCGNCMDVFNAIEHQEKVQPGSRPAPAQPGARETTPAKPAQETPDEEDFVFQDNPDEDAVEGRYAGTRETFSDDELSDSFREFDERSSGGFDTMEDEETDHEVDESWAEEMLSEAPASKKQEPEPEEKPHVSPGTPGPAPAPQPASHSTTPPPPDRARAPRPEAQPQVAPAPEQSAGSQQEEEDETWPYDAQASEAAGPRAEAETWRNLTRDPIAVGGSGSGSWLRKSIWTLVILGLVAVLVYQVAYAQFDRLSSIPELRPFYEKACEFTGCELEPLIAMDRIESRKLVVRTDPQNRNSLIVDAVIVNEADFAQPFPNIALSFSNLNGDLVAQSLFTPDDYLAGEAANLEAMPPDTPVRIAIRIRDPGRDAVNYNLTFQRRSP
ncbi:DUF3426 domain-containing protein [Marinobacter sp.]|uniref:DUF3426 domain-containing protein n=1 Tax=Marinobacter sp. TaxID=50741 RepID=UPI00384E65A4